MNPKPTTGNKLADGLASPDYCLMLHQLGCTQRTAFMWLQKADQYVPFTYEFDPDHYYAAGDAMIENLKLHSAIPAYSFTELERVIAMYDYKIAKENKVYQVILEDARLPLITVMNERLPDAMAAIILHMHQKNLLLMNYCNQMIRND